MTNFQTDFAETSPRLKSATCLSTEVSGNRTNCQQTRQTTTNGLFAWHHHTTESLFWQASR